MKITKNILLLHFIFFLVFSSCTIDKRHYRNGYNLVWNKSRIEQHKAVYKRTERFYGIDEGNKKQKIIRSEQLLASAEKELHFRRRNTETEILVNRNRQKSKEEILYKVLKVELDSCDVLVLKSGEEIRVKLLEINPKEIKYRNCEMPDGPIRNVRRADVFMIKYANGSKEVFKTEAQVSPSPTSSPNFLDMYANEKKTHKMAVWAFISSLVGLLVLPIPLGAVAVILGTLSLHKIGLNPDKFKGKGFALAALIIGVIDIIFGIAILLAAI